MVQISCPPYHAFPTPPSFFLGFLPLILFRLRNIKHCYVVSTISPASHPFSIELLPSALPFPAETWESPFRFGTSSRIFCSLRSPLEMENFLAIYAEVSWTRLPLAYWGKCCSKFPKAALSLLALSRSQKSSYSVYVNICLNHLKQ